MIIFLITIQSDHQVWVNELIFMGLIKEDTLRDAAIFNSWSKYSKISHGVHGLIFEPYHALFVNLFYPFLTDDLEIFEIFFIFSNMVIPVLIVYGCSKIINNVGLDFVKKNWIFFLTFFILTFSEIDKILLQKSFMTATLLYIGLIPLAINIITKPKNISIEILMFCLLVPITIYARAFHGILALGVLVFFLFIKKTPLKPLILLTVIASILFIIFFFGETTRSEKYLSLFGRGYFLEIFLKSKGRIIDQYFFAITLFILLYVYKKKIFNLAIKIRQTKLYFFIF